MKANTTFSLKNWDEKPFDEYEGGQKMTRALVKYSYTGDLEGESNIEYLMVYNEDGTGSATALERVIGKIQGRSGSFAVQHKTIFDAKSVQEQWCIIPGSGTGELKGLVGEGKISISGKGPYDLSFNYEFNHLYKKEHLLHNLNAIRD